ncbi:hypothetical protein BD310DRAFT_453939 [Dichomitus squalens]|uniref:MYND-type domain-containing protein n=1 Tax=Dichomitus squalens TaxID=114155 RepID=A0A4Q9PVM1_9APHY|nr:hypothetical protein BD310DRAFT_453939 [Dichomitus squalens]
MKRADLCLNLVTSDPTTFGATDPDTGRPLFSIGGPMGEEALSALQTLKDSQGRSPVTLVRRVTNSPFGGVIAVVKVDVPETELAYACAKCGKWEAAGGPRWSRCSGCKARYYCSKECQKEDWKASLHKGDCDLLKQGKAFEVERRRGLHDNDWFMNSMLSQSPFLLISPLVVFYISYHGSRVHEGESRPTLTSPIGDQLP